MRSKEVLRIFYGPKMFSPQKFNNLTYITKNQTLHKMKFTYLFSLYETLIPTDQN